MPRRRRQQNRPETGPFLHGASPTPLKCRLRVADATPNRSRSAGDDLPHSLDQRCVRVRSWGAGKPVSRSGPSASFRGHPVSGLESSRPKLGGRLTGQTSMRPVFVAVIVFPLVEDPLCASAMLKNQCCERHSRLSVPLKASMNALSRPVFPVGWKSKLDMIPIGPVI